MTERQNGGTEQGAALGIAKSSTPTNQGAGTESESKDYYASIYPGPEYPLARDVVLCVRELEESLNTPVWLLIQDEFDAANPFSSLDTDVAQGFYDNRHHLDRNKAITLLLHTTGGDAKAAYQIARLLQNRGGFNALIPRFAKSAGTLLALGAERIILAEDAELGPLDAQVLDLDREEYSSALDEVQALERLLAFALQAVDMCVLVVMQRSGKKIATILPGVQRFVADMTRPLFEKIDTVHYTQMSRTLKVAEEYAKRLLQPRYTKPQAGEIARALVHEYPEHRFMIDDVEADQIGLQTDRPTDEQSDCMNRLITTLRGRCAIGRLVEAV